MERRLADALDTVWNYDVRKAYAAFECIIADRFDAVWNCNVIKPYTTFERRPVDRRDAVWDGDAFHPYATFERRLTDTLDAVPVIDRRDFDVGVGAGSDSGNRTGSVAVGHEYKTLRTFVRGGYGGEDSGGFHSRNPFFPWRSSLGVMPLRAWRYHIGGNRRRVSHMTIYGIYIVTGTF